MQIPFNKFFSFVFFILLATPAHARLVPLGDYDYPIEASYVSTLTSEAIPNCEIDYAKIKTELRHWNGDKRKFSFYLSTRNTHSPKAIILFPGLGSSQDSNLNLWIACAANQMNIDVYVAPNSFRSQYARTSSFSGLPGEPVRDALEMLEFVLLLKNTIEFKSKAYKQVVSIGYSHGALLNAHLLKVAEENNIDLFDETLLINPPFDLYYGVQALDELAKNNKIGFIKSVRFLFKIRKWRKRQSEVANMKNFYKDFLKDFKVDNEKASALVAAAFKQKVTPVARFAAKKFGHTDIPTLPPRGSSSYRHAKSSWNKITSKINYSKYIDMFIQPLIYGDASTIREINGHNSFYNLIDFLKLRKNVRVITNADDFLMKGHSDVQMLEANFSNRTIVYPLGGHLGNLVHPDNMSELTSWLDYGLFRHEL